MILHSTKTKREADGPDASFLSKLEGVAFRPVFIMGLHRSGTTLLHRLLAETGCFNYVSAYDVICYHEILSNHFGGRAAEAREDLLKRFKGLGLTTRIIDETPAVPEAPIEYGFAIMQVTNGRPRITEGALDVFRQMARKMQLTGDPAKPLLLKNPWDQIYFLDLKRWFPDAKFIFIHRHPAATLNSQMRAMRSLFEAKNEFSALITPWYRQMWDKPLRRAVALTLNRRPLKLWERLMNFQVMRMVGYYLKHFKELPQPDVISLRYEDLCRDPDAHMKRITDFLGVHPPESIAYRDKIAPRESRLPAEIIALYKRLKPKLQRYVDEQGYSDPKGA